MIFVALRDFKNIVLYYLFRFECFTQSVVNAPMFALLNLLGVGQLVAKKAGVNEWEEYINRFLNNPKYGVSRIFADIQYALMIFLFYLTVINLVGMFFQLGFHGFWVYGLIIAVIGSFITANSGDTSNSERLAAFRRIHRWPSLRKLGVGLIVAVLLLLAWGGFILSFVFYLRASVSH